MELVLLGSRPLLPPSPQKEVISKGRWVGRKIPYTNSRARPGRELRCAAAQANKGRSKELNEPRVENFLARDMRI